MLRTPNLPSVLSLQQTEFFLFYIFPWLLHLNFSLFGCVFVCLVFSVLLLVSFCFAEAAASRLSGSLLVVDAVRTRTFRIPDPRSFQPFYSNNMMAALDDSSLFYNSCKHLQSLPVAKGLWQPGQSFILAGFILFLPRPDPCGSEHLFHRERPLATQHSLRNSVDNLVAVSHTGDTNGYKFGLLCTFVDQSKGKNSITFRLFWCPGVFAIAMVSFSFLKFLIFAK